MACPRPTSSRRRSCNSETHLWHALVWLEGTFPVPVAWGDQHFKNTHQPHWLSNRRFHHLGCSAACCWSLAYSRGVAQRSTGATASAVATPQRH